MNMSVSKHFEKLVWTVTAIMLVLTVLFMNGSVLGITSNVSAMGYEGRLFDNSRVHTIDIVMDDWESFISTCQNEEYSVCAVVIDGEAYKNVGIRGKGNTSLSTVSSLDSERYSFKIEFDQYDSTSSYYGLDKLSLNNLIQDNTMMKDYLAYTLMGEFGVASPLCSFAYITVNGEDWGLYLAVEGVEDAFLRRNYGTAQGELYKPDSMSMGGGRGNGRDFDFGDVDFGDMDFSDLTDMDFSGFGGFDSMPEGVDTDTSYGLGDIKDKSRDFTAKGNMGGFGGMGSSDVKLQYSDDSYESYSNIWNNAKTDITDSDKDRLIGALKKLSGEAAAEAVDTEQVIRYFVVHNYLCNGDSYTGSMVHNYYLYEENGVLSMIPWDYNLAFGTFQSSDAQKTVNTPIDSPVSGGSVSDRPMVAWIFESEEYTELYHSLFEDFMQIDIQQIISSAKALISPYVEKDPTKFCTADEFEAGVTAIGEFCRLRTESITKQLQNGNTVTTADYADASTLVLSDMGTMNMGGGRGGNKGGFSGVSDGIDVPDMPDGSGVPDFSGMEGMPQRGEMPGGASDMPDMGGNMPDMPAEGGNSPVTGESDDSGADNPMPGAEGGFPQQGNMQRPDMGGADPGDMENAGNMNFPDRGGITGGASRVNSGAENWIWLGASVILLCVGIIIAKKYKI